MEIPRPKSEVYFTYFCMGYGRIPVDVHGIQKMQIAKSSTDQAESILSERKVDFIIVVRQRLIKIVPINEYLTHSTNMTTNTKYQIQDTTSRKFRFISINISIINTLINSFSFLRTLIEKPYAGGAKCTCHTIYMYFYFILQNCFSAGMTNVNFI